IAPSGGCSVCDSRDVARGTIAAIEKGGHQGRQFILAGENWDYKRLWTEMAQRMGQRAPVVRLGPLVAAGAGAAGDIWAKVTGRELDVNSAAIRMSSLFHWHDSSRARRELGYQTRDVRESLDASAQWIRDHHLGSSENPNQAA
ncbi:MAG: HpnA protein, partial [Pirellulales bacterium]|nr:HpnA protein [Pirellulales bacterium]